MRKSVVCLFIAAGVFYGCCSDGRCTEQRLTAQEKVALRSHSADAATVKSFLGGSFQVSQTEHFAIIHEAGANSVPGTGRTLELAYKRFHNAFSQAGFALNRSKDSLIWICFPKQSDFNRYAQQAEGEDLSWLDAYYSTRTNRVAVVEPSPKLLDRKLGAGSQADGVAAVVAANEQEGDVLPMSVPAAQFDAPRLTHELAHQLAFNSGLQKRGVMYPFWVSEGLATSFEFDQLAGTGFEGSSKVRRKAVVRMHSSGELVPLRQFIVQTKVPSDAGRSRKYYAQAWALFQYMLTEHREGLQSYLHELAQLPPGQRDARTMLGEFTRAFGSLRRLESSWNAFLDRQAQEALDESPLLPPAARSEMAGES
jgi:hypothetical protein